MVFVWGRVWFLSWVGYVFCLEKGMVFVCDRVWFLSGIGVWFLGSEEGLRGREGRVKMP